VPIRRTYADHGDACAAAHALDVVGDRWAVVVIRELMLGPKRFSDLLAGALGATPTVLTTRLRELEQAGIVDLVELPPPSRVPVYQLTEWGRGFEPILQQLGRWAQHSPSRPHDGGLTADAAILAMRTMAGSASPRGRLAFDLGLHDDRAPKRVQNWYGVSWGPEPLVAEKYPHEAEAPDAIACDSTVWTGLMFSDQDIDAVLGSADVTVWGDGDRVAKRFLTHFRRQLKL
jgi:DNA-binding HxlR family transcriptional regulator